MPAVDRNQKNRPSKRGGRRPGAGRPSGVGNRATPEDKRTLTELAKVYAPEALAVLIDVARDKGAPPSSRVAAASALLDRSHGRPVQALEHGGKDGGPIVHATLLGAEATEALGEATAWLGVGSMSAPNGAAKH